jgi:hypothetical protein
MWDHKVGERHPVVCEIDLALSKAMSQQWVGIMIALRWPRYEVMVRHWLNGKGLVPDPDLRATLDHTPDRLPLKVYRGFGLTYIPRNHPLKDYITGRLGTETMTIQLSPLPGEKRGN